jgi:hypothetical protein
MAEVHMPHAGAHGEHPEIHHETSDVNVRGVLAFGGGLIVTGLFISLFVWVLFQYFSAREAARVPPVYPLAAAQENRQPPEPRLQTNPRQDLRDLRVQEEQVLDTYGWVDRNAGIVRIPITDAMKLTVQRGLPARRSPQGNAK